MSYEGGACGHRAEGCPLVKPPEAGPSLVCVCIPGPAWDMAGGHCHPGQVSTACWLLASSLDSGASIHSPCGFF